MGNGVDQTSVKGIWKNPKQAWAGIDDILPTGGRFGYEEAHTMNANEAKLLGFMKHARKELRTLEAEVPKNLSPKEQKEAARAVALLKAEEARMKQIKGDFGGVVMHRSRPQMLAAAKGAAAKKPAGRVYVDEAMYGEGIAGDMRSEGHKEKRWNKHAADKDMDAYYRQLAAKPEAQVRAWGATLAAGNGNPTVEGSNANFDAYLDELDKQALAKHVAHNRRLEHDAYYKHHPEEVEH
jgi:hypothetical protein